MPKQGERDDGIVGAENWLKLADEIFSTFSQAPHGAKETVLASAAAKHGVSPQTLRRLLAARQFLDRLLQTEPGLAQALRTSSFAAVEVIARWARWDRLAAADAARKLLAEKTSVRQLATAEQTARKHKGNTGIQRLPMDVALQAATTITREVSALLGRQLHVTWASHAYRTAVTGAREPSMFVHLREQFGIGPSGVALVLDDDQFTRGEIAVAILTRHPKVHAFSTLSMLAGLGHQGFGGLLVCFEPKLISWLQGLARAFSPAQVGVLALDPDILLGLGSEENGGGL
ncbi:hypothetical protein ACFPOB_27440 [Bosea eneae]|uniref:RpiR family transcriptional regulator n=1 Tax=Bosea eneae TaxID=151454 RepID=A0ABW0IY77_9HYPH